MDNKYLKIKFPLGCSIDSAVKELLQFKDKGVLARGTFNGIILYSDTVTIDGAYLAIIGRTKAELS